MGRLGEEEDREILKVLAEPGVSWHFGEEGTKLKEEREGDGCRRNRPGTRRVGVRWSGTCAVL